ncbi:Lrp/AsnC family transcriptional regulator [Ralstonia syzygii subsp. celebesensis]|uniref:Lrp/AsnC family transcriptional regulator n=1 Tax=Ralstonia syzygii TaxID=28097 RepID=UPI0027DC7456|nr:Lrp/AsnC ligand binding domain-containing protein [Ralstonia syzygii]
MAARLGARHAVLRVCAGDSTGHLHDQCHREPELGFPINAIIRIGASAERGASLLKTFRETPNVVEVMRVTGSDSYILHVLTRSSAELEAVIDRIGSFGTITTSLVLSIPMPAAERVSQVLSEK